MNPCIRFAEAPAALGVMLVAVIASMTTPAFSQDSFTRAKRATAQHTDRYGDIPLGAVLRTDERYNKDGLFKGPRGWAYWNYLENPKPYQNPNLWPDKRPTYFFGLVLDLGPSQTIYAVGDEFHQYYTRIPNAK
jgi:hypothetical protein